MLRVVTRREKADGVWGNPLLSFPQSFMGRATCPIGPLASQGGSATRISGASSTPPFWVWARRWWEWVPAKVFSFSEWFRKAQMQHEKGAFSRFLCVLYEA